MNKVKFEAETGAELRKQMLDFLGLNELTSKIGGGDLSIVLEKPKTILEDVNTIREAANIPALDLSTPSTDEKSTGTKKRRTKAEMEAEKAALEKGSSDNTGTSETLEQDNEAANKDATGSEQTTDDAPPETGKSEITRAFLTEIVLAKGREGKKPAMLAIFAKYKQLDSDAAVSGLPTLNPADYESFYNELKDL